jgi:hypothetical protein
MNTETIAIGVLGLGVVAFLAIIMPENALNEFVSTYREWHYMMGGFSVGGLLGVLFGIEYHRRLIA